MNPLTRALDTGFNVLLVNNGEQVIFRSGFVRAVVNRDPFDRIVRTPDFDPRDSSEIRLKASELSEYPRPGEEFTDENGAGHRVQTVKNIGQFYTCRCLMNQPDPSGISTEESDLFLTEDLEAIQAG